MKKLFLMTFVLAAVLSSSCTRIGPGYVGIKINLAGDNRGAEDIPLTTGWVGYNPLSTNVFEYPTFVQTAVWTANVNEGSELNEEITFNSRDGMMISGDISFSYRLTAMKVPAFYVQFRSDDLSTFTHGFLRNVARDAFNETGPEYNGEDIWGAKKAEFLEKVKARIKHDVEPYGVDLEQFGFLGSLRLPDTGVKALNLKIEATQKAIQVENQLREAEAEAKKRVAAAEGEAEANRILAKSLSPDLLDWRRLDIQELTVKTWNGTLPLYTGAGTGPIPVVPIKQP